MRQQLTPNEIRDFKRDGVVVVRGFYDVDGEIRPIRKAINRIIGLVAAEHDIAVPTATEDEMFDLGYQELIRHDRSLGGVVYDAVKQIPAFVRLVCSAGHEEVFRQIRGTDLAGVAAGGFGIRIDNPGEERFRADWHQEYPSQLRSVDGVVFWGPLIAMTEDMGPVQVCPGSHLDGLIPVHTRDPVNPDKTGAYALVLADREARIARYAQIAPLTEPGDLVLMDFLTLHASGHNHSSRSRWSMQSRLFNFNEPTGRRIAWQGSFAAGQDFSDIHPELVVT